MVVHQVVSETTPYQIQKKFYILGKFLLRKSYELVDAALMDDGTLCATYRGTNSFNAVITENKAIAKNLKIVEWNRFCAGKSGTDMKYAQQAL